MGPVAPTTNQLVTGEMVSFELNASLQLLTQVDRVDLRVHVEDEVHLEGLALAVQTRH